MQCATVDLLRFSGISMMLRYPVGYVEMIGHLATSATMIEVMSLNLQNVPQMVDADNGWHDWT